MRIIKKITLVRKNTLICKYIPNFKHLDPTKHEHDFCVLQGRFDENSTVLIHMGLNCASVKFTLGASLDNKLSARVRRERKTRATAPGPHFFVGSRTNFRAITRLEMLVSRLAAHLQAEVERRLCSVFPPTVSTTQLTL